MKLLVCEHLTAEGHANLFVNVCKLLTKGGYEVIAVIPQNFIKDLSFCKVEKMGMKYYYDEFPHKRSTLTKIKYCLSVQKFICNLYKIYDIGATFVVTYDEIALAIGKLSGYIKGCTFVFQNLNPDSILDSKIHRIAYNSIKNRVYSVVLGGFIKDILVSSLNTNPNRILVFPHPLNLVDNQLAEDIDCVGISNSNDETIIERIINHEKKYGRIKKHNLRVILKSRVHKYDNGNLTIISGFIADDIYDNYIARAKCIFLPFPLSFRSRISGTLIDALSNNKTVIGTEIPAVIQASKCYGSVIKTYDESSFVDDILDSGLFTPSKNENFSRFREQHSDDSLTQLLSKAIENAIVNKPMEDTFDF